MSAIEHDVIVGRDGYLFLHTGSNENYAYCSFEKKLNSSALQKLYGEWASTKREVEVSGSRYQVIIFPNKETLCWDLHPLSRNIPEPQSAGRLVKEFDSDNLADFFLERNSDLFLKTDTHFSALGNLRYAYRIATMADPELMRSVSFGEFCDKIPLTLSKISGDLGGRFNPKYDEDAYVIRRSPTTKSTSNAVGNRGFIDVLENEQASSPVRLLIFGDSYARTLRFYLSYWFQKLVLVHTVFYCRDLRPVSA